MDTLQIMKEHLLEVTPNVEKKWVDCDDGSKGTVLVETGWAVFSHKHRGMWVNNDTPESTVAVWYANYLKKQEQKQK